MQVTKDKFGLILQVQIIKQFKKLLELGQQVELETQLKIILEAEDHKLRLGLQVEKLLRHLLMMLYMNNMMVQVGQK